MVRPDRAAAQRIWTSLNEFLQDYYVDGIVPFRTGLPLTDWWRGLEGKLKGGLNYALRDRRSSTRSSAFTGLNAQRLNLTQPPGHVAGPAELLHPGAARIQRATAMNPSTPSQEIAAFYGMVDMPLIKDRLRFIGGARLEYSYIKHRRLRAGGRSGQDVINDLDPLPGVSLVYTPRDDMNVRAAFSQTVSRPEFRELTPVFFTTLPGERALQGNPNLVTANITNYDLRWEWFFTPARARLGRLLLQGPQEPDRARHRHRCRRQRRPTSSSTTTAPPCGASSSRGARTSPSPSPWARKVDWLAPGRAASRRRAAADQRLDQPVADLRGLHPAAAVHRQGVAGARREVAAVRQPPYVVNAALEYDNTRWGIFRLLYNTIGPTIVAKGTQFSQASRWTTSRPRAAISSTSSG